jgi:hypothetical protein
VTFVKRFMNQIVGISKEVGVCAALKDAPLIRENNPNPGMIQRR